MELYGRKVAEKECEKHPDLRTAIDNWITAIEGSNWDSVQTLKRSFTNVKYVQEMHGFVFNIRGNHYRLLASIDFVEHVVTILKVGKHEEYDYW